MTRRLFRSIALTLVALIIVGLSVQAFAIAPRAIAQEAAGCGPWIPFDEMEGTPEAKPGEQDDYQVISSFESITELPPDYLIDVVLTQVTLFDGGTLAVLSRQPSIIRVDSGLVQITICEGSQIEIQQADATIPTRFGAGTFDVPAGGALFIDADDQYYLTGASSGTATAEDAGTPTAATPVSDEARAGSTLTVVTWDGIRLAYGICGGAGC